MRKIYKILVLITKKIKKIRMSIRLFLEYSSYFTLSDVQLNTAGLFTADLIKLEFKFVKALPIQVLNRSFKSRSACKDPHQLK